MKIKIIGLYELITGILGIILVVFNYLPQIIQNPVLIVVALIGILLFMGTAYSGYALLNGFRNGVKYSVIAQALQTLGIFAGNFIYLFTGAEFLFLSIGSGHFIQLNVRSLVDFKITLLSKSEHVSVSIFLIPILFIILLTTGKKKQD